MSPLLLPHTHPLACSGLPWQCSVLQVPGTQTIIRAICSLSPLFPISQPFTLFNFLLKKAGWFLVFIFLSGSAKASPGVKLVSSKPLGIDGTLVSWSHGAYHWLHEPSLWRFASRTGILNSLELFLDVSCLSVAVDLDILRLYCLMGAAVWKSRSAQSIIRYWMCHSGELLLFICSSSIGYLFPLSFICNSACSPLTQQTPTELLLHDLFGDLFPSLL